MAAPADISNGWSLCIHYFHLVWRHASRFEIVKNSFLESRFAAPNPNSFPIIEQGKRSSLFLRGNMKNIFLIKRLCGYCLLPSMVAMMVSFCLALLWLGISSAAELGNGGTATVSIKESVISTLETNPRLAELKQNRSAVGKDLEQTRGRYYPRVDVTAGYGVDRHSDTTTRDEGTDDEFDPRSEASIILVQPLYQGGELDGSYDIQNAKLESADKRVLDNAEALALDAVIAHMEVWRQRQLLDLTDRNVRTHRQILNHIKERQRVGAGSTADVMQTNGRLSLTLSSRYQIEADVRAARANYYRVVGQEPEALLLPEDFRKNLPGDEKEIIDRVERCNPKLAALSADIRAAKHEVDVRKSAFMPKVNLELSTTYRDQVEGSQTYEYNNAAMLRARWNLFNGGSDTAARDAAIERRLQVTLNRKDQYEYIVEQVYETWSRYKMAGERVKAFTDAVEYNRQTRDAYQQQFVVGQRSLLDVLDAENEFFQSSGQYLTAKVNEIVAAYRLLALTGCLIRNLGIDQEAYDLAAASQECCGAAVLTDEDADGVPDTLDSCPNTPMRVVVDAAGCPVDKDKDGVPDYLDQCFGTEAGVVVDAKGCAMDTDDDGVLDHRDRCPGTPRGMKVNETGCPLTKPTESAEITADGTWLYKGIQFESNRWTLKPGSYAVMDEIAEGLKIDPTLYVEIQGHSDSRGNRQYNISLSLKRAQAVRNYLIHKGISKERITAKGYGPDRPIDTNETAAGRSNNRRVELKLIH